MKKPSVADLKERKEIQERSSAKISRKQVDNQWLETQARHESTVLGKLGQILVSAQRFCEVWASLKSGQVIVVTADGAMYKGDTHNVKTEKMTKMQERYSAEKQEHHFADSDPDTTRQVIQYTKFSAHNVWDTRVRAINTYDKDGNVILTHKGRKSEPKLDADIV